MARGSERATGGPASAPAPGRRRPCRARSERSAGRGVGRPAVGRQPVDARSGRHAAQGRAGGRGQMQRRPPSSTVQAAVDVAGRRRWSFTRRKVRVRSRNITPRKVSVYPVARDARVGRKWHAVIRMAVAITARSRAIPVPLQARQRLVVCVRACRAARTRGQAALGVNRIPSAQGSAAPFRTSGAVEARQPLRLRRAPTRLRRACDVLPPRDECQHAGRLRMRRNRMTRWAAGQPGGR
ncbi:hypothetical protein SAMN05216551_108135 [Chitinasiproducens palmae]|uniref:Uncharacterized protein n=1 Tax=Chitinasiproducens palmae TaxID=1770053 RepID=A0A1H2PRJ9_9BURK|nr:hypothetical protein SAMN05216551_108135 [Chitinasiproducens palmae]